MKKIILLFLTASFFACKKTEPGVGSSGTAMNPVPDHIVFVWLENKNYSQIIGSPSAPYINSLIPEGTLFENFHALGHPSYPEYIKFFSGTDNGKKDDGCINGKPYTNENLYTRLKAKRKTFAWYSEDLPATGSDICYSGKYVERHNPTQAFANVPSSANKKWSDFPKNYTMLENVVCISPNLDNDMHDGSIEQGDAWIKNNLKGLITWCKTHNSVFVIYCDEDEGTSKNHIPVIAIGQPVKSGYKSMIYYDHYNWTKTILTTYGAEPIENAKMRERINDLWK